MNKKFINGLLLATLVVGSAGSFTSCKDYDDDINDLQSQINAINVDLGKLQEELKSGKVITNIAETSTGIAITLGDGKVLNLTNGKDGAPGAPGTSWTIGSDGYWYENGKKTDYRAIGENGKDGAPGADGKDGAPGADGKDGAPGADGKDGKYYVPESDGYFWIYQDGKKLENSNIRWMPETSGTPASTHISAVFTGNSLTIGNVEIGKNENGEPIYDTKVFDMGTPVGSLEFIPSVMSSTVAYPTTDKPFYHIVNYLSEAKYNPTTKVFIDQTDWNKSNIVDLAYRVNPSNAYVYAYGNASFVGRQVVSRAAGDVENILNVVKSTVTEGDKEYTKSYDVAAGELNLKATINAGKLSSSKENIAALSLWNGQDRTVSDYIGVSSTAITATLVDSSYLSKNPTANPTSYQVKFYPRTKAILNDGTKDTSEDSKFIQQFCALADPANYPMKYNEQFDLTTLPGLYSFDQKEWLTELGFVGMSYKFSLPTEYLSDDVQHTNQQWFVELTENDTKLQVNKTNLTNGLTPAIGRTPVVRVDAFLTDNDGVAHLVGSAYIKFSITDKGPVSTDNLGDLDVPMDTKAYEYHTLSTAKTTVGQMDWKDVNNKIYGATKLTSSTFWNYYGGTNNQYEVKVTAIKQDGSIDDIASGTATADNTYSLTANGIFCETTLGSGDTQTSNIKFEIDNKVKTQHTYKNVDGKGAEYTVTITIKADNNKAHENVVITQKFYVLCESTPFEFNPNYYAGTYEGYNNVVITKGKLVGGVWKLEMNISEVFAMINGQNIFQYYHTTNNAAGIAFSLNPDPQTGVKYTETDTPATNGLIELTAPLTKSHLVAGMKYDITLVNGELCDPVYFNIWFNNPFVGTTGKGLTLNGNETGEVKVNVNPSLVVNDIDGALIYSWINGALTLSTKATNVYKVAAPTVTYEFVKDEAYNKFAGNLDPKATFGFSDDATNNGKSTTGVVVYDNLGATLIPSYNLTIKATVKFADLSEVTCTIPFTVKGKN